MSDLINDFSALISIVIPQYNGVSMLRDCIASLYKAADFFYISYPNATLELIVVDNASTDGTGDFLDSLCESKDAPFTIRVICNEVNLGFAPAVNQGIRTAKGKYVILLNNDTVISKEFVTALYECMEGDERIFSASAMMRMYHEPDLIDDAGDLYCLLGWAVQRGHGRKAVSYERSCRIFSSCGGASIYRRSVFEQIGFFDEHFFAYMEDVDIGYRAMLFGYRNVYCPKAEVLHVGSATSGSKYNVFKIRLAARNNVYVPYKNLPTLFLIVHLPFLAVGFFIKYLFFSYRGYGRTFREGLVEGLLSCGKLSRTPFRMRYLLHYLYVELLMIGYTVHILARSMLSIGRKICGIKK